MAGVLSLVWGECQNCLAEALLGGAGHLLGGVALGALVGYGLWLLRQRGRGA